MHEYSVTNLSALRFSLADIKPTEKLKLKLVYIYMRNDEGTKDRGNELNLQYSYPLFKNVGISGFMAFFKPGDSLIVGTNDNIRSKYRLEIKAKF